MYQIVVERSAEKDLKKLPSEVRPRAIKAIQALAESPRPPGSRKLAGTERDWRIRVGDFTALFTKSPMRSALCASTV